MTGDTLQPHRRRLAAVFAADIAGYSALMAADEAGTISALKGHQGAVLPLVATHGGRVVDTAGDGILAEFGSAVGAVECALAVQNLMTERNVGVAEARAMRFRIGVNLGEIVFDDARIYGDGVNVAARLEALAEPGAICVSDKVYQEIRGKLDVVSQDLGFQTLKNIAQPVRVHVINVASAADAVTTPHQSAAKPSLTRPDTASIAVLPFNNMSGDPEQEYFSDGISEDIITALSKISQMFVIARNSSFTFKGKPFNVQEVSKSLGVRYVLEGSVRKAGSKVRITAQLIDGVTGGHLWAERFDRDLTDIFAVQDEVTQHIVDALALKLTRGEQQQLASAKTDNLEAYDYFLRGRAEWWRQTKEQNARAQALLQRAVDLDPKLAIAQSYLAITHLVDYNNRWSPSPSASLARAHEMAQQAVAIDDQSPNAHWALSITNLWMRRLDEAIGEAERAISLDHNFATAHATLGNILNYAGRSEEALQCFERSIALDPYYPDVFLHFQAQAYFQLGKYETAIDILKKRLQRNPDTDISHVLLAASYGHLGRIDEARVEWREAFRVNPDYSLEHRRQVLPYKNPDDFEQVVDGLRMAGLLN